MQEICKLFELPARQDNQSSQSGSNFLPCLGLPSKSHCGNQIPCTFLHSPCQVGMKNTVKYWKDFLLYFTTLKTYCELSKISKINLQFICHENTIMYLSSYPGTDSFQYIGGRIAVIAKGCFLLHVFDMINILSLVDSESLSESPP